MPWSAGASWGWPWPTACSPTDPAPTSPSWRRSRLGGAPDRAQQRGDPLGALLPARRPQGAMCRAGARSMVRFCPADGIAAPGLRQADRRHRARTSCPGWTRCTSAGMANGLAVRRLSAAEAREYEPHVAAVAALHVASTGIVDYGAGVRGPRAAGCATAGADLRLGAEVLGAARAAAGPWCAATARGLRRRRAGQLRRPARRPGGPAGRARPPVRIVPFRGEYYELRPERRHLVRGPGLPGARPALPVPRAST